MKIENVFRVNGPLKADFFKNQRRSKLVGKLFFEMVWTTKYCTSCI